MNRVPRHCGLLLACAIGATAGGLVLGLTAVVAQLFEPDPVPTFHPGEPISAAAVNARFAALEAAMQILDDQAVLTRLEIVEADLNTAPACPRGYTRKLNEPTLPQGAVLCVRGQDEVVKVGDFWADRHEGLIVDADWYNDGHCDGQDVGLKFGSTSPSLALPATFPRTGNYEVPLYACSIPGHVPSGVDSWFRAQQACTAAGKHLITNEEWQAATAGTPDPGASGGGNGACRTQGSGFRATGIGANCQSNYGAMDTIGNMREAVAYLGQMGWPGDTAEDDTQDPSRRSNWSEEFGGDGVINVLGDRYVWGTGGKTFEKRLPAGLYRGGGTSASGNNDTGDNAGSFAAFAAAPTAESGSFGFRCALRQ